MGNRIADKTSNVFMLTASKGEDDGRFNMFVEAVKSAGLKPVRICFSGSHENKATNLNNPSEGYYSGTAPVAGWRARISNFAIMATASLLGPISPVGIFASLVSFQSMSNALKPQLDLAKTQENAPKIILAKHWTALPGAIALANRTSAHLWFDINEVFEAEHAHKLLWRVAYLPAIRRLVKHAKRKASIITLTSRAQLKHEGNAQWLYLPNHKPPSTLKTSKVKKPVKLVYVGLIEPNRAIDQIIKAIARTGRSDIEMNIVGYGPARHVSKLKALISREELNSQITICPPVPNRKLVDALSTHDIGICVFSGMSDQYVYSEPNKIYEYLAAGLGIIATKNKGISNVLKGHASSILIDHRADNIDALTDVIEGLSIGKISQMKKASGDLGKRLWAERSSQNLLAKKLVACADTAENNGLKD